MSPTRGAPAQVLGHEPRLVALDQTRELAHVLEIQRIRRTESRPDAVQAQRVVGPNALQKMVRLTAVAEVVLAVHLDPAYGGATVDDLAAMWGAQANPAANRNRCGSPASAHPLGHRSAYFLLATTVPPAIFSQVPLGT